MKDILCLYRIGPQSSNFLTFPQTFFSKFEENPQETVFVFVFFLLHYLIKQPKKYFLFHPKKVLKTTQFEQKFIKSFFHPKKSYKSKFLFLKIKTPFFQL